MITRAKKKKKKNPLARRLICMRGPRKTSAQRAAHLHAGKGKTEDGGQGVETGDFVECENVG